MEITLNIKPNTYKVPTEVRQDVVQSICDTFMEDNWRCVFHPFSNGMYRNSTLYISMDTYGFYDYSWMATHKYEETFKRFNGAEMKAAFKALINAGYHMYRIYEYGDWMGYKCSEKPYDEKGVEVFDFDDFID